MDELKFREMGIGHFLFTALDICHALDGKKFKQDLTELGLTLERFIVLHLICMLGEKASLSGLVKHGVLEAHTISASLSRMEKDGLVVKTRFEKPKNMIKIGLTQKGRDLLDLAWQRTPTFDEFWKPFLSVDEVKLLIDLLLKLENSNMPVAFGKKRVLRKFSPYYDRDSNLLKGYRTNP